MTKIVHMFNLGGNAILLSAALNKYGIDTTLVLSSRSLGPSFPRWFKSYPELEGKIKVWNSADLFDPGTTISLLHHLRKYKFLHVHPPGMVLAPYIGRPYNIFDGGNCRVLVAQEKRRGASDVDKYMMMDFEHARRGYKYANLINANDMDTNYTYFAATDWRYEFTPLPCDTDVFSPGTRMVGDPRDKEEFVVYLPTRQVWRWKNIMGILQGYKHFIELTQANSKLYIAHWGINIDMTEVAVKMLKLEKNVVWLPLVPKMQYREFLRASHVVIDQISLGAMGGIAVQAMAVGKPVIVNANMDWYEEHYPRRPPILQANNAWQVTDQLLNAYFCYDKMRKLGKDARQFAVAHHDYRRVVLNYIIPQYERDEIL